MRKNAPFSSAAAVGCALAVGALPAVARAVTRAEVTAAVAAYEDLRYDEAKKLADEGLASSANGPEDLAALYRVRGEVAAAAGDKKTAQSMLERLLALDPGAAPSPDVSPKIAEAYVSARARWKEFAPFSVTHRPPDALEGGELVLSFKLESDPLDLVKKVVVHYQLPGAKDFKTADGSGLDEIEIRVPVAASGATAVAYYAAAVNERGSAWKTWGDAAAPIVVPRGALMASPPPEPPPGAGALAPPGEKKSGGLSTAGAVAIVIGGVMVASVVAALLIATTR